MSSKMRADLLILNGNQMCTLRGPKTARTTDDLRHLGTVPKAAVAMDRGRIVAVGSTEEIKNKVDRRFVEVVDATGKTIIPGFVDPHTHAIFAGSREDEFARKIEGATYMEILEEGGGILRTMVATRNATKAQLAESLRARLDHMLTYGTTSVEVKSGYGLSTKDEIKCLEVIKQVDKRHRMRLVPTFLGAHVVPIEHRKDPDAYVDLVVDEMLPKVAERKLANYCDVFCEKGVFSAEQSKRILSAAKGKGLGAKIHCDEIEDVGGVDVAVDVGAVSAEHLVVTSEGNMRRLAENRIIAVLLPGTPYVMMDKRYPNARAMIDSGVPVALATDLNPNCWTESMQMVLSLACTQMHMTPEEAISAATINAAHAVGLGSEVGSIEVGKRADILVLEAPNYLHLPYRFGTNLVDTVIKNGKVVREDQVE